MQLENISCFHHNLTSAGVLTHLVAALTDGRTCGIPSVRADLPPPRIRRVSDTINYHSSASAADLLQPSIYAVHGVHEEQLFCPRSKKEVENLWNSWELPQPWTPGHV